MGTLCGKYETLLEEEETLMGIVKDVEAAATKLIRSYSRMEIATELIAKQLKYMLNVRNKDCMQRSSELAAELLKMLKDDVGTNLQQAMTVFCDALRKIPFKNKEFRKRKNEFDFQLSRIINLKLEERQAVSAVATACTEDESNPTNKSEISTQTVNTDDEDKQKSLRDQTDDKAESLVAENKNEFKEYRKNNSDLNLKLAELQTSLRSETKKATDVSEELQAAKCKLNEQLTIATSATVQLEQLKEITNAKMLELQQDKVILQKQCSELLERNKQETDELKLEKLELQDQLENMLKEVESLQQLHKSAKDENTALKEEIKTMKQKPLFRVQIFSPLQSDRMAKMENEIMSIIKDKLGAGISEFELVQCEQKAELCPSFPIIVLCINVLRLGTDVSTALQGLKPNSKMAVVIFHHKNVHALPNQASERVLVDPSFKALGGIFDLGFQQETGIYECDMNECNISKLIAFIKKHVQAM